MSRVPSVNTVSLGDSLDSLNCYVQLMQNISLATNEVMADGQSTSTRIQGYNNFAAIDANINTKLLNQGAVNTTLQSVKTEFEQFLGSLPLTVTSPSDDHGQKFRPVQYTDPSTNQQRQATVLDLVNALNGKGSAQDFYISFHLDESGDSINQNCSWNFHKLSSSNEPFGIKGSSDYDHDFTQDGITINYGSHATCSNDSDGHATFTAEALEKIAYADNAVDANGNISATGVDLTQNTYYKELQATLSKLDT